MSATLQFCVSQSTAEAEVWQDASALGFESVKRIRVHAGLDTVTCVAFGQSALTDDPGWNYNTTVRLRRVDGSTPTLLFLGRVQPYARTASGVAENAEIEIRGVWDWLEKTVMRQTWREYDESVVYAPHVVLFSDGEGNRITTGAQIRQALNCAIDAGCPIQIGDILDGYTPPFDEQTNVSVADVLAKCLANHPHAVLWVDYSTRTPTVNVAERQSLPSSTVALSSAQAENLTITSREDLQPPALAIAYIRHNTDGERTYIETTIDHAPTVDEETQEDKEARLFAVDTVWGCFELDGSAAQYVEQELVVEPIDWDANKNLVSWWQAHVPGIANASVISISNPSGTTELPNFIIEGSVADWMDVEYADETFTADALVERSNSQGVSEKKVEKISFTAKTTDGTSKKYRTLSSYDSGETPPTGLAASMWAEWSQLHFDGQIDLCADDVPAGFGPGMTLNISGGRTEWASMKAMVSRVSEDYATGSLSVSFGVPDWIDLDSRMAWIRNCRTRRVAWSRNMQGESGDTPAGVGGPMAVPTTIDGIEPTVWLRQRFINPSATTKHEVDINLDDISGSTKRTLKLREVVIPYVEGGVVKSKTAIALCSDGYGSELSLGLPSGNSANMVLGTNASNVVAWLPTVQLSWA